MIDISPPRNRGRSLCLVSGRTYRTAPAADIAILPPFGLYYSVSDGPLPQNPVAAVVMSGYQESLDNDAEQAIWQRLPRLNPVNG